MTNAKKQSPDSPGDDQLTMHRRFGDASSNDNDGEYMTFEPKFPYALLLDSEKQVVFPEVHISTEDYNQAEHKGRVGCPCCGGALKFTPKKQVYVGGKSKNGFFSTNGKLEDIHEESCEFIDENPDRQARVSRKYKFLSAQGQKLLYWNLPQLPISPIYDGTVAEYSPLNGVGPVFSGKKDEDEATYQVSSMKELLNLSKHKSLSDPFWNDVFIYVDERRIAFSDFMIGKDVRAHLTSAFQRAVHHKRHAQIKAVTIPVKTDAGYQSDHGHIDAVGYYFVKASIEMMSDAFDRTGVRKLPVQTTIYTRDNALWNDLIRGGEFLIHGLVDTVPNEIRPITQKIRENDPHLNPKSAILRTSMHIGGAEHVVDFAPYLAREEARQALILGPDDDHQKQDGVKPGL